MYFYIRGKVVAQENGFVVLDNNGVGYKIFASSFTLSKCDNGQELTLLTHLQIKEDGHILYGFFDKNEREMFEHLTTISGIGCKLAITILSGVSPFDLAMAIVTADTKMLKSIKGVGTKTAERIVLELKEKITAKDMRPDDSSTISANAIISDAILALQTLGWSKTEAVKIISGIEDADKLGLNALVSECLKRLGKTK